MKKEVPVSAVIGTTNRTQRIIALMRNSFTRYGNALTLSSLFLHHKRITLLLWMKCRSFLLSSFPAYCTSRIGHTRRPKVRQGYNYYRPRKRKAKEWTDEDQKNMEERDRLEKTEKKCAQCKESINYFAKRCPYCRSKQGDVYDPMKRFGF